MRGAAWGWTIAGIAAAAVTVRAGAGLVGSRRWRTRTHELHARLSAGRAPLPGGGFDRGSLRDLPAPVRRYLESAVEPGRARVAEVAMEHAGSFDMGESEPRWRPFSSRQRVVTRRPGFVWDARISALPGLPVHVHDAYVFGVGVLRAAVLGLVPVTEAPPTPELAEAELMRFLAETPWYPTALLPGQGVTWRAVDDASAQATLADGSNTATLLFRFREDGLVESVRAEARGRSVGGEVVPTPWEGRWESWQRHTGLVVPLEGEVSWLLPEGRRPYWRGRVVRYETAPAGGEPHLPPRTGSTK